MRKWTMRIVLVVLVALAAGGIWWAFRPQPIPVDVARVEPRTLERWIEEDGRTRAKDVFKVAAPIAGRLERMTIEVGDAVEKGTILARIRPAAPAFMDARAEREAEAAVRTARAALNLATAQVQRAEAERRYAGEEQRRVAHLVIRQVMAKAALEKANMGLDAAEASVRAAEAEVQVRRSELQRAEAHLMQPGADERDSSLSECCVRLEAPIEGVVLDIQHESETVVAPGTPIVDLADPRRLEVVVDLLTEEALSLPPRTAARLEGWGGGRLKGRLERIEPVATTKVSALGIEEQRVQAIVAFEEQPNVSLGHGYRVQVGLLHWNAPDVQSLPVGALFRSQGDWAVFLVEDGKAVLRRIEVGRMNDEYAEVLSGASHGAIVIAYPSDRISNGTLVAPR